MKKLYCPDCWNYLEGGDGSMVDCICGWKQPNDQSYDDGIRQEVEDLAAEVERLTADRDEWKQSTIDANVRFRQAEAELSALRSELVSTSAYADRIVDEKREAFKEIDALRSENQRLTAELARVTTAWSAMVDEAARLTAELAEAKSLIGFLNEHCDAAWDLVDADPEQLERIKKLVVPQPSQQEPIAEVCDNGDGELVIQWTVEDPDVFKPGDKLCLVTAPQPIKSEDTRDAALKLARNALELAWSEDYINGITARQTAEEAIAAIDAAIQKGGA